MHSAGTMPMHILLGTDGSSHAIAAGARALELMAHADILTLLAVAPTPAIAFQGFESGFAGGMASTEEVQAALESSEVEARAALAATVSALESTPRPGTIHQLVETGEPGALLCRLAIDLKVDVVVVGSRGRGVVQRALLGSVSTYVTHHAVCPVLVVPSKTITP
jgi:nucleotide-binding universal stress UspA family protein